MTVREDVRLDLLKEQEGIIHAQLHEYYTNCAKINAPDMMYDESGATSFVVVAFNRVQSADLLPEDAEEIDKLAAVACATNMVAPDVTANEQGSVGPDETIPVGVHAAAASILLSSIQNGAVVACMKQAQGLVLGYHHTKKKLN